MSPPRRLDRIDVAILNQFQKNACITNAELEWL
jgi:DNA-binding Lrp family transcriptional regulator